MKQGSAVFELGVQGAIATASGNLVDSVSAQPQLELGSGVEGKEYMLPFAVALVRVVGFVVVFARVNHAVVVEIVAVHEVFGLDEVHEEGLLVVGQEIVVDIGVEDAVAVVV